MLPAGCVAASIFRVIFKQFLDSSFLCCGISLLATLKEIILVIVVFK
jgi:hypothetical protein